MLWVKLITKDEPDSVCHALKRRLNEAKANEERVSLFPPDPGHEQNYP